VHAEGFSTPKYQLTSFACMSTGRIEGRTVGEGTAGVFTAGVFTGGIAVVRLSHCGSVSCTVTLAGTCRDG
jgi:hypothetical protein